MGVLTLEQLGPDSVRITIDITVRVNGRLYASLDGTITISGDTITETVTVTGPGRDNEALLAALTLASADLFDVIDDLLDPIESLSP